MAWRLRSAGVAALTAAMFAVVSRPVRKGFSLGLVVAVLGSPVFAAVALGAPANTKLPTISGKPAFGSLLTCNRGNWSADAVTFDFSWVFSGGGPTIATGQKWHVDKDVDYDVTCQVVAHDAQGATTSAVSAPVLLTKGISSVRITAITQKHGNLTFTCVAGPSGALKHTSVDHPYASLGRKLGKDSLLQLGGLVVIKKRNGHFTISGHDTPGKHTYVVQFVPAGTSQYDVSHASKTVAVKR
jgi:hypothetical protein